MEIHSWSDRRVTTQSTDAESAGVISAWWCHSRWSVTARWPGRPRLPTSSQASFHRYRGTACELIGDRTPVPSAEQRGQYPSRVLGWLDGVPDDERDEDAATLQAAAEHFGVTGDNDRHERLITHNFVIAWFVRYALDAPVWRWIGLNQANCAIIIVQWDSDRPPACPPQGSSV